MSLVLVAALVLFIVGCGIPPPCEGAYPYAKGECVEAMRSDTEMMNRAATSTWQYYGTRMPCPTVVLYERGDCSAVIPGGPTGATVIPGGKITLSDGRCVFGAWYPLTNTVYMTRIDWQTTIAHELLHQKLKDLYGDADPEHVREEWKTLLPAAKQMLAETYPGLGGDSIL